MQSKKNFPVKNELDSYFGKNYQTDPSELKGLNSTQKSNFSIIVN